MSDTDTVIIIYNEEKNKNFVFYFLKEIQNPTVDLSTVPSFSVVRL